MGLYVGRGRLRRASTAPQGNLSLDSFISNNKLGKRIVTKPTMQPVGASESNGTDVYPPSHHHQQRGGLRKRRAPSPAAHVGPPSPSAASTASSSAPSSPPELILNGCNGSVLAMAAGAVKPRLNEAQRLLLHSDCHKTRIYASKLRHVPSRCAAAAGGGGGGGGVAGSVPPVLQANGESGSDGDEEMADERRRHQQQRRRRQQQQQMHRNRSASLQRQQRRRLITLVRSAAGRPRRSSASRKRVVYTEDSNEEGTVSGSDGPPHLEPQQVSSLQGTRRPVNGAVMRRRGGSRGRPMVAASPLAAGPRVCRRQRGKCPRQAQERRPRKLRQRHESTEEGDERSGDKAESDDELEDDEEDLVTMEPPPQLVYAFESEPGGQQWFRTYSRQPDDYSVVPDVGLLLSAAAADDRDAAPVRLPYQMSHSELHSKASGPSTSRGSSGSSRASGSYRSLATQRASMTSTALTRSVTVKQEQLAEDQQTPTATESMNGESQRGKHRRLLQLGARMSRTSPRCHASTLAAVRSSCGDDVPDVPPLTWDTSLEQLELAAASISSLLSAAVQEHRSEEAVAAEALAAGEGEEGTSVGRRLLRRRTVSAESLEIEKPSSPPPPSTSLSPEEMAQLLLPPPAGPEAADDALDWFQLLAAPSVVDDAPSESGASSLTASTARPTTAVEALNRRRPNKRRKNLTGWPRKPSHRRPIPSLNRRRSR